MQYFTIGLMVRLSRSGRIVAGFLTGEEGAWQALY